MDLTRASADELVAIIDRLTADARALADELEPVTAELKRRFDEQERDHDRRPRPR